jgi:hypothetical protein
MSLQASEALQKLGKIVRRFELRCVAGLDLDRLEAAIATGTAPRECPTRAASSMRLPTASRISSA